MFRLKNAVTSLDELCRELNVEAARHGDRQTINDRRTGTINFPKFGGVAPPDVSGIWSWDPMRLLLTDGNGNFFIEPRDPEAWYPNEKDTSLS